MKIAQIISLLEEFAPLDLQEKWDNSGIQVGDVTQNVRGILLCLDVTEEVIDEALEMDCNLIVSHHPLLFKPLQSLTGKTYIERGVIKACKNDLVVYSAHTNLDNVVGGVNFRLAEKIGLLDVQPLNLEGAGVVGQLPAEEDEESFLQRIKSIFQLQSLKHSPFTGRKIREVALCGGSGAFLIKDVIAYGADVFLTGEAKYNDYYDVENRILLAVLGHYESELCTKELFFDIISKKIPNFAIYFSNANANPVNYM
ncbi:hypothetical protein AGMMS50262_21210 [Bacteroidia bacterium]|nr:hypothetical protein AGMMS50262_21210 [Bacteroidia bacterium]